MSDENNTGPARQTLRAWIIANAIGLTEQTLTDTTPLFANRHLSSLHLPELLLLLERLRGARIDVTKLKAAELRDVRTLCAHFLDPAPKPLASVEGRP